MKELASRIKKIKPSPTLAINAKAKAMRDKGLPVINLAGGEPDFDTPDHIKEGAIKALKEGFTKYTPSSGILELKEAICQKLYEENGLLYTPQEIIVTCGGKQALYNAFMALFEEGDEVIIPAPYWVSYPAMALLAGARPVIVKTEEAEGFKVKKEALQEVITERTKAIIINSPSNPSGTVYTEKDLWEIAELALQHDLWIISDEVYEHLIFDNLKHVSIASLSPEIKERTLVVNAVSKTYSMTGWRIGFAAGPKELISAMEIIQSQSTSNPTSFAQKGALEALRGSKDFIHHMREEFEKRRDHFYELITSIPQISCFKPQGAFYLFPNFGSYCEKPFKDDGELCLYLLEKALVATVPGSEFGTPGFLRLSFTVKTEELEEAAKRIRQALEGL